MDYTSEQLAIFEFVKSGKGHAMINAVAGAGKTTTIMGCANYVNDLSKTLFCAFNRSIRNEIADKFTRAGMNEITVKTMHRLGFDILMDTRFNGANVSVMQGVTIGAGCVIAAGSVVTKDIPENCLVAGVPATIKKRINQKQTPIYRAAFWYIFYCSLATKEIC